MARTKQHTKRKRDEPPCRSARRPPPSLWSKADWRDGAAGPVKKKKKKTRHSAHSEHTAVPEVKLNKQNDTDTARVVNARRRQGNRQGGVFAVGAVEQQGRSCLHQHLLVCADAREGEFGRLPTPLQIARINSLRDRNRELRVQLDAAEARRRRRWGWATDPVTDFASVHPSLPDDLAWLSDLDTDEDFPGLADLSDDEPSLVSCLSPEEVLHQKYRRALSEGRVIWLGD